MKLLILCALVAQAVARPDDDFYELKYKNWNMDEILGNTRLLKSYGLCFLGTGKCTPQGKDVSKHLPEGIQTSCAKCSPDQKTMVAKFMKAMQEKCPEEWEALQKKNDPEGKYKENVKKFISDHAN